MMDRRELLYRASMILGGAISASAAAGVLAGCTTGPSASPDADITAASAKGGFLKAEELAIVTAMAEQIIPRTDTPGAIDAGVPAFIDRMLTGFYQAKEQNVVRVGLAQVATDAAGRGKPFAQLASEDQVALMKGYDQAQYDQTRRNAGQQNTSPHFFRMIKELTIIGYCMSQAGATSTMRYEQNPGPFRGDVPYSEIGKAWAL